MDDPNKDETSLISEESDGGRTELGGGVEGAGAGAGEPVLDVLAPSATAPDAFCCCRFFSCFELNEY